MSDGLRRHGSLTYSQRVASSIAGEASPDGMPEVEPRVAKSASTDKLPGESTRGQGLARSRFGSCCVASDAETPSR